MYAVWEDVWGEGRDGTSPDDQDSVGGGAHDSWVSKFEERFDAPEVNIQGEGRDGSSNDTSGVDGGDDSNNGKVQPADQSDGGVTFGEGRKVAHPIARLRWGWVLLILGCPNMKKNCPKARDNLATLQLESKVRVVVTLGYQDLQRLRQVRLPTQQVRDEMEMELLKQKLGMPPAIRLGSM